MTTADRASSPTTISITGANTQETGVTSIKQADASSMASNSVIGATSTPVSDLSLQAPLVHFSEHLLKPNGSISGKLVADAILPRFPDLLSVLPVNSNTQPALACIDGREAITVTQIRACIVETGRVLHSIHIGRGHRLAVVLPNGPELAMAILATTTWTSCVPLNAFGASQELEADLINSAADLVIGLYDNPAISQLADKCRLPFYGLVPDSKCAGLFTLVPPLLSVPTSPRRYLSSVEADCSAGKDPGTEQFEPNQHEDEVLVLFTSGTTGSKKLVPHLLADVLVATACIAVSWKLTPCDTNCNLMPLFHVGGIIRQVFSPILSGGCVICCPSFDPAIFWQLLVGRGQPAFTWYYAAPTMHQLILQMGRAEGYIPQVKDGPAKTTLKQRSLRMIANAAGGLLPSLARDLRKTFKANVLPCYGMTECMPITSPPATYQLEKPGTSGVAVGPEVAILDIETMQPLQAGMEGPICVRSEPCFRGYGILHGSVSPQEQPVSFLPGGWFNTGDLGHMDTDGYLYITGRSKEIINRGGEIISPMEVEEAINGHPDIQACVAFSTQHSVLQEVVGLLVVPEPNRPRVDLPTLQEYLGEGRLAAAKWPQCLVYIDAVPKSHTNKLLRVKLGQRFSLPEINDSMYAIERTYQATCPPIGTPVSVAILCERVMVNAQEVQSVLHASLVTQPDQDLRVVPHPTKIGALVAYVLNINRLTVVQMAKEKLDAYSVPGHVCLLSGPVGLLSDLTPPQQSDAVGSILQEESARGKGPVNSLVMELQELVQVLLDLDCLPAPATNFFNLGGSSMLASQLASRVRKLYDVPFGGVEVFQHPTCNAIAAVIRGRRGEVPADGSEVQDQSLLDPASVAASSLFTKLLDMSRTPFDPNRLEFQSSIWTNIFQLIPLFVVYPVYQITRFFLFFRCLIWILHHTPGESNLYEFILTLVVFHFLWVTFIPLFFVLVKWTIIGKYREGRYAIWSEYYLRWWFVDVLRKLTGRGIWGSHEVLLRFYYRLLGAEIGKNARISVLADVAEFDLVTIGENAAVEYSTVRAFGVDNGAIILGPIRVGNNSSVGVRSVVAPYTEIPDGRHLGPATSSYDMNYTAMISTVETANHLSYNRQALPEPFLTSQIFIISPIVFFVNTASHMPAMAVLFWMITMPWHRNEPFHTIGDLMEWLCDVRRVPFYIGIRVARATVAPLIHMACAILVKWLIIGKFKPGPRDPTSEWDLIRHHLAATLFSRENMQECIELLGRHYEPISILYRLLGAKVGKRVFWPGHQPVFTGEFDLLEIGDDVVFGSRSSIFCTTVNSCEKIILCAGANVSDNSVVLPGSIIGKNAVLGSNSLCPAGRYLPEQSVWFGSRMGEPVLLEKGPGDTSRPIYSSELYPEQLQMEGDATTLRPFGRAYYYGETSYRLLPVWFMMLFTCVTRILIATLHTLPIVVAIQLAAGYFYGWSLSDRAYDSIHVSSSSMYNTLLFFFFIAHFAGVVIWFYIEVFSKWFLIGNRTEGRYNYDTSSYAQRWELYQIITRVRFNGRMNTMDFITGSPFMAAFFRALGLKTGKDCCLYPTGGDPYMPEPDLVEMGDRCVIDCASIISHLNTRGNFELSKIIMGNNVTLRTRSRIQQAVHMEENSMLLEKSLAMTGEVIEADSIWVGAPAVRLRSYDTSSISTVNLSYDGSNSGGSQSGQFV
jgi:acyl-CoA synthetase (AMP-forming)/AMP-acid ligase II/acetyltransferase-like isoleucine patch superfamily enzyme